MEYELLREGQHFKGERLIECRAEVYVVDLKGRKLGKLDPCLDLLNKSPAGFEWGYSGQGPTQLAFALGYACFGPKIIKIRDFTTTAIIIRELIVAKLDHSHWELSYRHILRILSMAGWRML